MSAATDLEHRADSHDAVVFLNMRWRRLNGRSG